MPRRTVLILSAAAVVFVATVAAAIISAVVRPIPPRPAYASLPEPCALVSQATLARYLPGATGTPQSISVVGTVKAGFCKWSSNSGGEDTTLAAGVFIFRSPSALSDARQSYRNEVSAVSCHCKGVTVSTRSVTGVGDQAAALFVTAGPGANIATAANASLPGTDLIVRSSNAEIVLNLDVTAAATGMSQAGGASQLAGTISAARDILAALARPASVSSRTAPVSPEPDYAGERNPCALIAAATLARYAPGAEVASVSAPGGSATSAPGGSAAPSGPTYVDNCDWESGRTSVTLAVTVFPGAAGARQGWEADAEAASRSGTEHTVSGTPWLADLGEAALAVFQDRSGTSGVEMLIWSGNAELDYWYTGPGPSSPDRATLLAGGIAMARDGLAALASPAVSAFPTGPRYATPDNACTLVRASTLDRYAASATVMPSSPGDASAGPGSCFWTTSAADFLTVNYFLSLDLNVDATVADALERFIIDVHTTPTDGQGTTRSVQPVRGLGNQATAIYQVDKDGSPTLTLCVWSADAQFQVAFTDMGPPIIPALSRARMLAADIAMARDILALLPRS